MNREGKKTFGAGVLFIAAFAVFTMLVKYVDLQAIGPNGTDVGFAAMNARFHRWTGVHMRIYDATDWLSLVPIAVCMFFGGLGLCQWLKRKSLLRVDADILLLGVYYGIVMGGYLVFEMLAVHYRPVLIEGRMEASYPSSTTLLVLSVMSALVFQAKRRLKNTQAKKIVCMLTMAFSILMVLGRLVSGVHWLVDIVGSCLLSAGLFYFYKAAVLFMAVPDGGERRGVS